jgi:hypothetical protein
MLVAYANLEDQDEWRREYRTYWQLDNIGRLRRASPYDVTFGYGHIKYPVRFANFPNITGEVYEVNRVSVLL